MLQAARREDRAPSRRTRRHGTCLKRHREARALLLRRGVGALEADRSRCADCGRTPLIGEHVHLLRRPAPARSSASSAAGAGARRRSRARSCATASTARPCASPPAPPEPAAAGRRRWQPGQ